VVRENPARAAALFAKSDGPDRAAELRLALRSAEAAELERWVGALEQAPPSQTRDRDRQLIFELWARQRPSEALARAETERDPRVRAMLFSSAVTGAMTADPAATLQRVARDGRDELMQPALDALAQLEPGRALDLVRSMPEAGVTFRQRASWAVVEGVIAGGDYERGCEIVRAVGDPALQARLAASLADAWGRAEPRSAATWAASLTSEAPERAQTLANIGSAWAAREPRAATEFAAQLAPGAGRQRMLAETMLQWAASDLVAASDWLNRFDSTPDNDPAVAAIATDARLIARNPEVALSWAESISVPAARLEALGAILRTWTERDPAAAQRYLNQAPTLKAEERMALTAMLRTAPKE
jgi:hypothetical protein